MIRHDLQPPHKFAASVRPAAKAMRDVFGAVALLLLVGITGLVLFAGADVFAGAEEKRQPSVVNPPGERAGQKSIISVLDGRLSVEIQNELLSEVLKRISREGKVAIIVGDGLAHQRVSGQFQDVPLAEGLRQLLQAHDAFFFFSGVPHAAASPTAVWVYPKGRGQGLAPLPPEAWASTKEFEARLGDPDPESRARAVEALVSRKRDRARDALLQGLRDEDDGVRTRSLWAALRSGVKLPADVLRTLALGDRAPHVRFLALQALAGDPNLGPIVEQALNDPSPHVRSKAEEILRERERARRRSPRALRPMPPEEKAGP